MKQIDELVELPYNQEEIDTDILDLVDALNLHGIPTIGSCSGHGKEHGYIILKDERTLIILQAPLDKDYITRELQFCQSIKLKSKLSEGEIKKKVGEEIRAELTGKFRREVIPSGSKVYSKDTNELLQRLNSTYYMIPQSEWQAFWQALKRVYGEEANNGK